MPTLSVIAYYKIFDQIYIEFEGWGKTGVWIENKVPILSRLGGVPSSIIETQLNFTDITVVATVWRLGKDIEGNIDMNECFIMDSSQPKRIDNASNTLYQTINITRIHTQQIVHQELNSVFWLLFIFYFDDATLVTWDRINFLSDI